MIDLFQYPAILDLFFTQAGTDLESGAFHKVVLKATQLQVSLAHNKVTEDQLNYFNYHDHHANGTLDEVINQLKSQLKALSES